MNGARSKAEAALFGSAAIVTIVVLILIFGYQQQSFVALAQGLGNDTDSATITINISQIVLVDINPNSTCWGAQCQDLSGVNASVALDNATGVFPGNITTIANFTLTNDGSVNITAIDIDATNPTTNPFGTGTVSNYNAGNFIMVSNATTGSFYFIDELEFNDTNSRLDYIKYFASNGSYGRFRLGSHEFFWELTNNSAYGGSLGNTFDCANGSTLFVGTSDPHTKTNTGDIVLTNNAQTAALPNAAGTWGFTTLSLSNLPSTIGTTANYCVAINSACTQVRIFKYKQGIAADDGIYDSANACTNGVYDGWLFNRGAANALKPGESYGIRMLANIPYGVQSGRLGAGVIYLRATADSGVT